MARAGVELIQAVARFRGDGGNGDEFYTDYVKIQMGIAESAWVSAGERNYNCGPGAPVSLLPRMPSLTSSLLAYYLHLGQNILREG